MLTKVLNLTPGTKLRFLTGHDKNRTYTLLSDLHPCARTEGCYTAKDDKGITVCIFPSELNKHGYILIE